MNEGLLLIFAAAWGQASGHVLVRPRINGSDALGFFILDTGGCAIYLPIKSICSHVPSAAARQCLVWALLKGCPCLGEQEPAGVS